MKIIENAIVKNQSGFGGISATPPAAAPVAISPVVVTDALLEATLEAEGRFDTLWHEMNANEAHSICNRLQNAASELMILALDGKKALLPEFEGNMGQAVEATRAAIELCRKSLLEIEAHAALLAQTQLDAQQYEIDALRLACDVPSQAP